jgi:hypothetical protein
MILTESLEVTYYEIDNETRNILETFQDILKTLLEIYHTNSRDKRGQIKSLKDFKRLKQQMKRYHNYPFMQPVFIQLEKINKELIDAFQSKREIKKQPSPDISKALQIWKSGNTQQSISVAKSFINYNETFRKSVSEPLDYTINPLYIENPLIFRSNNFLETFEKEEITYVANLDLDEYKYSYLNLNELSINNFQYIAYFMLKLSDKPETTIIKGNEAEKSFKMAYSGEDFDKLLELVEDYLSENKKENIPEIINLIDNFPNIKQANENSKQDISTVYRGYPDYESDTKDDIIATSKSKQVAKRFAMQIGHFESEKNRRSDVGTIDTYEVAPDAIILDTTIFGGIYSEQEVIIDVTKATKIDSEEI